MSEPANPAYAVGDTVRYVDRHNRSQSGKVLRIEATWSRWTRGAALIGYTIQHPTYRNNICHARETDIVGLGAASHDH